MLVGHVFVFYSLSFVFQVKLKVDVDKGEEERVGTSGKRAQALAQGVDATLLLTMLLSVC